MHAVIANQLHTRKDHVRIVLPASSQQATAAEVPEVNSGVDVVHVRRAGNAPIEEPLVAQVVALHAAFRSRAGDAA